MKYVRKIMSWMIMVNVYVKKDIFRKIYIIVNVFRAICIIIYVLKDVLGILKQMRNLCNVIVLYFRFKVILIFIFWQV